MSHTYYFAYGSNMSARRLLARVPSVKVLGSAVLAGFRLAFHKRGFDGSAKCDVVETITAGAGVYGVLYALDPAHLRLLDLAEGCGFGYRRNTVRLIDEAGSSISAECYFATDVDAALKPYCWYLAHVLIGAREAKLPEIYIAQLASAAFQRDPDWQRHGRELAIYRHDEESCDVSCRICSVQ